MTADDLSTFSMHELFKVEADAQTQVLTSGLLALERDAAADQLESCMRAAHSLKGAARIIGLKPGVDLAHVMEECFVAAQRSQILLNKRKIDLLLRGVDLLAAIANTPEAEVPAWSNGSHPEVVELINALAIAATDKDDGLEVSGSGEITAETSATASEEQHPPTPAAPDAHAAGPPTEGEADRVLRVTADNLNRLLGLTSELLVESRWFKPFAHALLKLKRQQHEAVKVLGGLRDSLSENGLNEITWAIFGDLERRVLECQRGLSDRLSELELFDQQAERRAHLLHEEALDCRMRPFADGVRGFPRLVRDLAHQLGKRVHLDIIGLMTQVDRDILDKLEAPLGHLLRNAIDHGLEDEHVRRAAGKDPEGVVRLEARHSAGMLQITISDDGCGIDVEKLRAIVVERNLTNAATAARMSESELLEFLFLPGFSTKQNVTDISGRGVGLDVVQTMLKQVRGLVRISTTLGKGTQFQLQLPLTLSVVRSLLVEIAGEAYAFPLAHIGRTVKVAQDKVELLEGRQHFRIDGRQVGLVLARQVLATGDAAGVENEFCVILLGDAQETYGLVVDRFLGERELAVQALDPRLGKIKDITAAAVMEDGSLALIIDVEDILRSVGKLIASGHLDKARQEAAGAHGKSCKRVLVVDDSVTVRELQRKLLSHRGYDVEVEVDGMDGWNAARTGHFDLIITDVDMPRMDGIELVTMIKSDSKLHSIPVMIVSYKDRDEDRQRGLNAGADYYLTKGSFHDETLIEAVRDLIGEPTP